MKLVVIKSALVAAALAALAVSVHAQQSVRTRAQQGVVSHQILGFARSTGGGTTGGSGGIITGPAPNALSPFEVFRPVP